MVKRLFLSAVLLAIGVVTGLAVSRGRLEPRTPDDIVALETPPASTDSAAAASQPSAPSAPIAGAPDFTRVAAAGQALEALVLIPGPLPATEPCSPLGTCAFAHKACAEEQLA